MSDLTPVIVNGIGSPRAWLFTNSGEPLRDFDEQIIAKYLNKFKYTYNEEEDDECILTFLFPTLRSFDLPYFQQDVILNVEWGYITTDGDIIKSPRRKIAIRDYDTDYKKDGIELVLKCTDIASYLKNMKTQRVNQYRTVDTRTSGDPRGDIQRQGSKALEDVFYGSMFGNKVNVVKKDGNTTTVHNKNGEKKVGIKDPTTGIYKPVDRTKKPAWSGGYGRRVPEANKIDNLSLRNLGNTTFNKAVETKLYWSDKLNKLDNGSGITRLDDSDGPSIMDGTDDTLEIKTRDFNQPIFKSYTYYGGTGELLSFKANTETRKDKEQKTVSSGVDPYSKKVVSHAVDVVDTGNIKPKTIGQRLQEKQTKPSNKIDESILKEVFEEKKRVFQEGYNTLDPSIKEKKNYSTVERTYKNNITPYMGYKPYTEKVVNYTSAQVIASPEFKDYANKHRNPELKGSSGPGGGLKKILTGYSIESIQRKYSATAETIGDPSIIKGKVYQFNNLGRLDIGKWYATSVEHTIEVGSGYITTITLMKNPKPIGISSKTYSSNPKYDKVTDEINITEEMDIKEGLIYEPIDEEKNTTMENMDNVQQESKVREANVVAGMSDRLNFLNAENDSLKELIYNEGFKYTPSEQFIEKPKPNSHNL